MAKFQSPRIQRESRNIQYCCGRHRDLMNEKNMQLLLAAFGGEWRRKCNEIPGHCALPFLKISVN
jgi:hypothetical protein